MAGGILCRPTRGSKVASKAPPAGSRGEVPAENVNDLMLYKRGRTPVVDDFTCFQSDRE